MLCNDADCPDAEVFHPSAVRIFFAGISNLPRLDDPKKSKGHGMGRRTVSAKGPDQRKIQALLEWFCGKRGRQVDEGNGLEHVAVYREALFDQLSE
ncbi:hypothetical protein CEQ18_032665 [Pseudomonas aeruginosa]|uniref:hypothetical protein n=1 Tax=Pseudomonas aeruginosa TaxID=287 RepID=UPI000B4E7D6A|nr:hypothetical protein [Pseudomonas aeruginosa]PNL04399.1 hypothetical protein CEQ18_032665 [Pseudomonas aeruginosa]